jgi:hypothetical protein
MRHEDEVVRCKIRTNLRPLKLAYLIEDGDFDALRHVIEFACTDWGGMRNFIVPIRSDGAIHGAFGGFLKPHPPDFFLHYLPDSADPDPFTRSGKALENLLQDQKRLTIFSGPIMEANLGAHPLSVVPDEMLDSPTRPKGFGELLKQLNVFRFPKGEDYIYLAALFGVIFPGQEDDYASSCLINERKISLDHPSFWSEQVAIDPAHSPLQLTTCAVAPTEVKGTFPTSLPYVLVLVKDCFTLAWFWNYRAIRDAAQFHPVARRTILVPERLANDRAAIGNLLSFIRTAPHLESETSNLDFAVVYADESDRARFAAILAEMSGVEELKVKVSSEWWFGKKDKQLREADPERVLTYQFGIAGLPVSLTEGFATGRGDRNVTLQYGGDELEFEPPPKFVNRFNSNVVIDLQSSVWERYPRSPAVANAIMPHSWWTHYGLSFRTVPSTRPTYFRVNLLNHWNAYLHYFADQGYEVARSRSADYADAVIELVGGINNARVFANDLAYRLLQKLTVPSSKKLAQRLEKAGIKALDDEGLSRLLLDAEVIEELKAVPKTAQQLADRLQVPRAAIIAVLHSLSIVGALRRGFHLPCPQCGTPSWHFLGGLEEHLLCPGCRFRFHLPVESPAGSELAWHYSLNSLVNRAMDQDVLPAILALNHIAKAAPMYGPVPGLELRPAGKDNVVAEFDFVLVRGSSLLAGECKAGTELSEKDFNGAELAATLGIVEFIFCTPAEFGESARAKIDALRAKMAKKMEIRVLQRPDLFGEQ